MMLGTIWYILFNVISGASAIPQDLRACTQLTHLLGWQKWRTLWLPGIFPALTTGWITAAGGAWNASIVSEYLQDHNPPLQATGLGALISNAPGQRRISRAWPPLCWPWRSSLSSSIASSGNGFPPSRRNASSFSLNLTELPCHDHNRHHPAHR